MKTSFLFIITLFISMGSLMSALNSKHPLSHIAIGWGVWYLLYLSRRGRINRRTTRRQRAAMHEQCMRVYLRNNGYN